MMIDHKAEGTVCVCAYIYIYLFNYCFFPSDSPCLPTFDYWCHAGSVSWGLGPCLIPGKPTWGGSAPVTCIPSYCVPLHPHDIPVFVQYMYKDIGHIIKVYMYVSMYVSMYLCIYVSMYLCIYVSMYRCIDVSMYRCMYVSMYLCIYVSMYVCIIMHILSIEFDLYRYICHQRWQGAYCRKSLGRSSAVKPWRFRRCRVLAMSKMRFRSWMMGRWGGKEVGR